MIFLNTLLKSAPTLTDSKVSLDKPSKSISKKSGHMNFLILKVDRLS